MEVLSDYWGDSDVTINGNISAKEGDTNNDEYVLGSAICTAIANAAFGENLEITTSDRTGLTKEEVDALKLRSDISLTIIFTVDGVKYRITIPAGAALDTYRNASGGVDFITLANLFGFTKA